MKSQRAAGAAGATQKTNSWVRKADVEKQREAEYLADKKKEDDLRNKKEQEKIERIREVYREDDDEVKPATA